MFRELSGKIQKHRWNYPLKVFLFHPTKRQGIRKRKELLFQHVSSRVFLDSRFLFLLRPDSHRYQKVDFLNSNMPQVLGVPGKMTRILV